MWMDKEREDEFGETWESEREQQVRKTCCSCFHWGKCIPHFKCIWSDIREQLPILLHDTWLQVSWNKLRCLAIPTTKTEVSLSYESGSIFAPLSLSFFFFFFFVSHKTLIAQNVYRNNLIKNIYYIKKIRFSIQEFRSQKTKIIASAWDPFVDGDISLDDILFFLNHSEESRGNIFSQLIFPQNLYLFK